MEARLSQQHSPVSFRYKLHKLTQRNPEVLPMIPPFHQNQRNAQLMAQESAAFLHTPNKLTPTLDTQTGTHFNTDADLNLVPHRHAAIQATASVPHPGTAGTQPLTPTQELTLTTPRSQQDDTLLLQNRQHRSRHPTHSAHTLRRMKRKIMQRTQRELDAASPDLDKNWTPSMPNNWIGSNFDASIPKQGCVRHLSLNVRTMSHSESGLQDQAQLWTRRYDFETGIVALSDTSLMDNTPNELRNSLFRSTQITRQR